MRLVDKFISKLPDIDDNILILNSGGLDSSCLIKVLVERYGQSKIQSLIVNIGQKNNYLEIECAKKVSNINNIKFDINFTIFLVS